MVGTDVITRARIMLNDTVATYRFSDTDLLSHLNDGIQACIELRPDLAHNDAGTTDTFADLTAIGGSIGLDDYLRVPLAHYVAYRAFGGDDPDTANQTKADTHYKLFVEGLYGSGA